MQTVPLGVQVILPGSCRHGASGQEGSGAKEGGRLGLCCLCAVGQVSGGGLVFPGKEEGREECQGGWDPLDWQLGQRNSRRCLISVQLNCLYLNP